MRQAGRYLPEYRALRDKAGSFWALASNPLLATEITLQPITRFDLDAAIIFSDILTIPYALGQDVTFTEGHGPVLGPLPNPLQKTHSLDFVYEAIERVRTALPRDKALIGFAGGPWTLACYMLSGGAGDFMPARTFFYEHSDKAQRLLETVAHTVADHLIAQARAGADALQIFESHAGLVPSCALADRIYAPTRLIVDKVRSECPHVPLIGFPRGLADSCLLDYVKQTGVSVLSLDERTDITWAAQNLGPHLPLQGNLDPACLLAGGPALTREALRIMRTCKDVPFIFNLGHGVHKDTPPKHIEALVQTVRTPF